MVACVKVRGREPFFNESLYISSNIGLNLELHFLYNSEGYPSGPGLLLFCINLIAFASSFRVRGLSKYAALAWSILGKFNLERKVVILVVSVGNSDL